MATELEMGLQKVFGVWWWEQQDAATRKRDCAGSRLREGGTSLVSMSMLKLILRKDREKFAVCVE